LADVRDFDVERQERQALGRTREFKLDGQTFTVELDVRPEVIVDYLAGGTFSIDRIDALLRAFLVDESWGRFQALRAREVEPLTIQDIGAIAAWLIEEETVRPTRASGGSSPGRATSGTSSTEDSPSPATETGPTASLSAVS
jgi:hypothetical protein